MFNPNAIGVGAHADGVAVKHLTLGRAKYNPDTLTPESGTDPQGNSLTMDLLSAYQFTFADPTLDQDATLTFEIDVTALAPADRAALLAALSAGNATVAVKNDDPDAMFQTFALCGLGEMPVADECVTLTQFDADHNPIASGEPAFVRFDGVTGHFSSFAVVLVAPMNPPDAQDDAALSIVEGSGAQTLDVLANDTSAPDTGETLSITAVTQPAHGTVVIIGGGSSVSYAPAADFFGSDTFTYSISDGNGGSDTAVVRVTVLLGPDTITGRKFENINANGVQNLGEPGLDGWTISLVDPATGQVVATQTPFARDLDGNGQIDSETERGIYHFANVTPGSYEIQETQQPGWRQTFPFGLTQRVSQISGGAEATSHSFKPTLSADGRFVAFESLADNLVPNDTNGASDIFVLDRQTGAIERVSVSTGRVQANDASFEPSISADGQVIVFNSFASNLVSGDRNNSSDVFAYDRRTRITQRVSRRGAAGDANGDSFAPAISGDGRFVAYESAASNLVSGDANNASDVFIFDLRTGLVERVSVANGGIEANADSFQPALSFNGQFVALASFANNLVADDTNGQMDVFVFDRNQAARSMQRISVASTGEQGNDTSFEPTISADGRFVAFTTLASNLVSDDSNDDADVVVFDRASHLIERISGDSNGIGANDTSTSPSISGDGRFVTFASFADNLVPDDTNAWPDVFLFDRFSKTISRVSLSGSGVEADDGSADPVISADGRFVAFGSFASNFVPGDSVATSDVFVHANFGVHAVTLGPEDVIEGRDFGNQLQLTRFVGQTFDDRDADGIHDADEPGQDGWTIELLDPLTGALVATQISHSADLNGDGQIDPLMEQGLYQFEAVRGRYEIREINQAYWEQTVPMGHTQHVSQHGAFGVSLTDDGRFVAYLSQVSNLVPGDTNNAQDVFLFDRRTGFTERISVNAQGEQSNGNSFAPRLSADGRFIAFASRASNLVPDDTNNNSDVFVYDRVQNTIDRLSVEGHGISADVYGISDDGRFVALESSATDLVPEDTNQKTDVFVFDRHFRNIVRVSVAAGGQQSNEGSFLPSMSGDGRFVTFQSSASNLVPGDTNNAPDIFLVDRSGFGENRIQRVSVDGAGNEANGRSENAAISADGRFVAFVSQASNLVPSDRNGVRDAFVFDRVDRTIARVNIDHAGNEDNRGLLGAYAPSISGDGRFVAFSSFGTNLVPGAVELPDPNDPFPIVPLNVYVADRATGQIRLASVSSAGEIANSQSLQAVISADGRLVTFLSPATNLVEGVPAGFQLFARAMVGIHDVIGPASITTRGLNFGNHAEPIAILGQQIDDLDGDGFRDIGEPGVNGRTMELVDLATDQVVATQLTHNRDLNGDGMIDSTTEQGWYEFQPDQPGDYLVRQVAQPELIHSFPAIATSRHIAAGINSYNAELGPAIAVDAVRAQVVVFASDAPLQFGDSNGMRDIFVQRSGFTTQYTNGNGDSDDPTLSANGQTLSFVSAASNLVTGDTNSADDIFVIDVNSLFNYKRISVANDGAQANGHSSNPSLSADGQLIAFESTATNLVPGDTNNASDIFVYDRQSQMIRRVSVAGDVTQANGASTQPVISADGRFVAFVSQATNLTPVDATAQDVLVVDLQTGVVERIAGAGGADIGPSLSADGRFVAFSSAFNTLPFTTTGYFENFVYDRQTSMLERISVNDAGEPANLNAHQPRLSGDGRYVVYYSAATNLVPGDTIIRPDVFLFDRQTHSVRRMSVDDRGNEANGTGSAFAAISPDGQFVAFLSDANNLISGDTDGLFDVFIHSTAPQPAVSVATGQRVVGLDFGNFPLGSVSGIVFEDQDNSGTRGDDEPALAGWTTFIDANNNGSLDPDERSSVSDVNGSYQFDNLRPGTYVIREVVQPDYAQTAPAEVRYSVTITSGLTATGRDFGNRLRPFVIRGQKFEDLDADGVRDPGEPSLNGWTMELVDLATGEVVATQVTGRQDLDGNGVIDPVLEQGVYEFVGTAAGTYWVRERNQTGWLHSFPAVSTSQRVRADSTTSAMGPVLNSSGRFVAFVTAASLDLLISDTNGRLDVYVQDLSLNGTRRRFSSPDFASESNGDSRAPVLSADGRYLAFSSQATNLVFGDTNGVEDIFLVDAFAPFTFSPQRLSIATAGSQANGASRNPSISGDGRYVVFESAASNLVADDTNGASDIFLHDRLTDTTRRVSVSSAGNQANAGSSEPQISADGRFVTFTSSATNVVPSDTNFSSDVFVVDLQTGSVDLVSVTSTGGQAIGASFDPAISADGRFVAFTSLAANLAVGDVINTYDVFVFDRETRAVEQVSAGGSGSFFSSAGIEPSISADGRVVAFSSTEALATDDTNTDLDVYLFDRQNHLLRRISVDDRGNPANSSSSLPAISGDGQFVVFVSAASNLAAGDTNSQFDVFVHSTAPRPAVTVSPGQQVLDLNFGNYRLGSIAGRVFEDQHNFGLSDADEPGLAGWTVFIDANNNGLFDNGEMSRTTPANGDYQFNSLHSGTYVVREILQDDYDQSAPATRFYTVTVTSGQSSVGRDFGNYPAFGLIEGQEFFAFEDEAITVNVLSGIPSPADRPPLTLVDLNTTATIGSATITADGRVLYTPDSDFFGSDRFTFRFRRGTGALRQGSAQIVVQPVNDAPTVDPLTDLTLDEDFPTQSITLTGIVVGPPNENQMVSVTAESLNTSVIPNPRIEFALVPMGIAPNVTLVTVYSVEIDSLPNATGEADIRITVGDTGGEDHDGVNEFSRTFRVLVNAINDAPVMNISTSLAVVTAGAALNGLPFPALLDPNASVSDVDTAHFNGEMLSVEFIAGAAESDRLDIFGTADIVSSPDRVLVRQMGSTVDIGRFSGGDASTPLVIQFNANATPARVQTLFRNLEYRSTISRSMTEVVQRTVSLTLTNGDGGIAQTTKTIGFDLDGNDVIDVADINVFRFSQTNNGDDQLRVLEIVYLIRGGSIAPFQFVFFSSNDPRFDGTDVERGSRVSINDPDLLSVGEHAVEIPGDSYAAFLADLNTPFFLVTADKTFEPAVSAIIGQIPETNETNNDQQYVGAFLGGSSLDTIADPLIFRGGDPGGRALAFDDLFVVSKAGVNDSDFALGIGNASRFVPVSAVSEIRVLSAGGDDRILATQGGSTPFRIRAGAGNDTVVTGTGADTIEGEDGDDSIESNGGHDSVVGGNGADSLSGAGGNDTLIGLSGDDTLSGGLGNDSLQGGNDSDLLVESGNVSFTLTNSSLTGLGTDTLNSINRAHLIGGSSNNTITATNFTGMTTLDGGGGNDSLSGGSAADSLIGGIGNDTLKGNGANDSLSGGAGSDSLVGGSETDRLFETGDVNFTLTNTSLTGLGTDTVSSIEQASLTGGNANNTINVGTFSGPTTLDGGAGNDSLIAGGNADQLVGGSGNDTLLGGNGADTLSGGLGDDSLVGGNAGTVDLVKESANVNFTLTNTGLTGLGTDTLSGIEQACLAGGDGNNVINAAAFTLGPVTLIGSGGNDTLTGGSGNDSLDGGGVGADTGGSADGNDSLDGGGGNDTLFGRDSNDTLLGGAGDDRLEGGAGNDSLVGGGNNDYLKGDGGDDNLDGGQGNDTMDGAIGADVFAAIEVFLNLDLDDIS